MKNKEKFTYNNKNRKRTIRKHIDLFAYIFR